MSIAKIVVTNDDGTTIEFDAATQASAVLAVDPAFPQAVIEGAQISHKKFWPRGPFVSVDLAQWALESGYGKHRSGLNNYFGIKATKSQIDAGAVTWRSTREETADGKSYWIQAAFANYASLADCFDAHATLLTTAHYAKCQQAQTPEAYCDALQECGYATANNYAEALKSIIKVHGLKRFDQKF